MVETDKHFNIWSPLAAIRPNPDYIYSRYLFHFFHSKPFRTSIELGWSLGTQQNIGMGVIGNLGVTLPPLPEQKAIAAFLDEKTGEIDELLGNYQTISKSAANEGAIPKMVVLLQEYRAALITAAVTGKIDVRDYEPEAVK